MSDSEAFAVREDDQDRENADRDVREEEIEMKVQRLRRRSEIKRGLSMKNREKRV
jgi:hypothetical protein